jgi:hypothetical protein
MDVKSDIALLISVASLLVSSAALYFNKLQPGRPAGGLSYAVIWRFSNLPDFTETDFTFSPVLWITNVGVRPLVIVKSVPHPHELDAVGASGRQR